MKEGEDMKNILLKLMTILVMTVVMSLLYSITNYKVEAAAQFDTTPYTKDIKSDSSSNTNEISNIGTIIIGVLRGAGTVLSVIVLAAIGIKYMLGSVEEKATYKQTLLPYLIGAVMVFGITNILPIIVEVAKAI